MQRTILLVQSDLSAAKPLADFFTARGDRVIQVATPAEGLMWLGEVEPNLIALDLHFTGNEWLEIIQRVRRAYPNTRVLLTNQYPDLRRELAAKQLGCEVFLRQPFTSVWIERAIQQVEGHAPIKPRVAELPRVRMPVRLKIILPFALLALVFAASAAYLISQYVVDSIRDRFDRQLLDAATLTADWMVREESAMLETLRLVANTEGVAQAVQNADAETARRLVLPIAVNAQAEAVEVLDFQGVSVLSLYRQSNGDYESQRGETVYQTWPMVLNVLARREDSEGDKYAGLAQVAGVDYFYTAGPILNADGSLAGVALVGQSLNQLSRAIREQTLAHVTFYAVDGQPFISTLGEFNSETALTPELAAQIQQRAAEASYFRNVNTASANYTEALAHWTSRNGETLGLVGSAITQNFAAQPTVITQVQTFVVLLAGILFVIGVGWLIANHITRPLKRMVTAAEEVAHGNFQVKLQDEGSDEVSVLTHSFNRMVAGLQEGSIYRDLLGRTVSPAVREQLRDSFTSGDLHLDGQMVTATVLMTDIRGFTTLSEREEPTTVLKWLNEYFSELAPVISAHGGIVDKFEGDAMLAFFGVLPRPMPPRESAYQACLAALEMLKVIEAINARRAERGEPLFITGVGINTGKVTAGGLGAADRLNYTIIGDAVNTTQRIESFTREFNESAAVVSETTFGALRARQALFDLRSLGAHMFKGKSQAVTVYRLLAGEQTPRPLPATGPFTNNGNRYQD